MSAVMTFIKKNTVMCIAFTAAAVTALFVHPDREYLKYFDVKTLSCLFCVLAVVCAFKNISFFTVLAHKAVECFRTTRTCFLALAYITFVGSMLIANDMALLTFLPLGSLVLIGTGKQKYMAILFIMQNISANLGGMLTPFGNPQNLYLYSKFNISNGEFVSIMLVPFLAAVALITVMCLFIPSEPLEVPKDDIVHLNMPRVALYCVLFTLSIMMVFRGIPFWIGLAVIPGVLLFADRNALRQVDYPLLLTFSAFFIFAGNMSRIETVQTFFAEMLQKNTLIFSELSCQFISNVPSAILLSQFTDNYRELLWGVNIGGTGTLIASLASLITFREFQRHNKGKTKYYLGMFTAVNVLFLLSLTAVACLIK